MEYLCEVLCGEFVGDMTATWSYNLPCNKYGMVRSNLYYEDGRETGKAFIKGKVGESVFPLHYVVIDNYGKVGEYYTYPEAEEAALQNARLTAEYEGEEWDSLTKVMLIGDDGSHYVCEELFVCGEISIYSK